MNERIKEIRKTFNLTQKKMGEKLGITEGAVSNIEKGKRNVSEQVIKLLCKEFNVDYIWLTTGEGNMFQEQDDESELFELIGNLLSGENEHIIKLFKNFSKLDQEELDALDAILDKLLSDEKKELD